MSDLAATWQALCARLAIPDPDGLWQDLATAYGEPHRYYHTLAHIGAVAGLWTTVCDRFEDPDAALLAVFFHDIIYDPSRHDNEARSADVMRDLLAPHISSEVMKRASWHIWATKKHEADADTDTNLVLDIDMSILGAPWTDYLAYARDVAREYLPVYGMDAYAAGRVALFLTPTLESDRIFLTDAFAYLDTQTRLNLAAERDLWQNGAFGPI